MIYKILADVIVLAHFLWILFLFLGGLIGNRNKTFKVFHLSGLFFAVVIQLFNWYCPLTHLEVWLRSKHNPGIIYTGSFIIHYVEKIVYLELSRPFIFGFTLLLLVLNMWFYFKKKKPGKHERL